MPTTPPPRRPRNIEADVAAILAAPDATDVSLEDATGPQGWDYVKGLGREIGQGAALGFGDELEAGLRTGFGRLGDYRATRDRIRRSQEDFERANRGVTFLANLAGGLMVPGMGGAAAAGRAARVVGTPLARAAAGAAMGAGYGALAGAGAAPELQDIPSHALVGAGVGAAAGGVVFPTLGAAARGIANTAPVSRALDVVGAAAERAGARTGDAAQRVTMPVLPRLGAAARAGGQQVNALVNSDARAQRNALRLIGLRLNAARSTDEAMRVIQEAQDRFGIDLTLPDLTRNVSGLARAAANSVGPSRDAIPAAAMERAEMMPGETARIVSQVTGVPNQPLETFTDELVNTRQLASRPFYEAAYADGQVPASNVLLQVLHNPLVRRAHAQAVVHEQAVRDAGQYFRPLTNGLYNAQGRLTTQPHVADIDVIKQGLDASISNLESKLARNGALDTPELNELQGMRALRGALLEETERALPQSVTFNGQRMSRYARARAFETTMRGLQETMEQGANFRGLDAHRLQALGQEIAGTPAAAPAAGAPGTALAPSTGAPPPSGAPQLTSGGVPNLEGAQIAAARTRAGRTGVAQGIMQDLQSAKTLNGRPLTAMDRFQTNFGPVRQPFMRQTFGEPTAAALNELARLGRDRVQAIRDMIGNSTTARQAIDAIAAQQDALPEAGMVTGAAKFLKGGAVSKLDMVRDLLTRPGIDEATSRYLADYLTRGGPQALEVLQMLARMGPTRMNAALGARGAVGGTTGGAAAAWTSGQGSR